MKSKEYLENIYNQHFRLPFPETAENDALSDCKGDLAFAGAYIIGALTSYLFSDVIPKKDPCVNLKSIWNKLEAAHDILSESDQIIWQSTSDYLKSLENIWTFFE